MNQMPHHLWVIVVPEIVIDDITLGDQEFEIALAAPIALEEGFAAVGNLSSQDWPKHSHPSGRCWDINASVCDRWRVKPWIFPDGSRKQQVHR